MDGTIVDIKRFTLHDGEGIRSTLFLKGCPLRCAWCQNPEGIEASLRLWYFERQCIRCRGCAASCPAEALRVGDEHDSFVIVSHERCTACGACVEACPTGALAFDGRRISAAEAAATLLRDRDFYLESGGGITISGGDPIVQHEFALEVLGLCRREGVRTAIETCLFGDPAVLERFIPLVDLFIVDLKLADESMHEEYTHRPNSLIRSNFAMLAGRGVELLTRIPLIPGITATESNLRALALFIRETKSGARVELVNFNPLAVNKYELMNRSVEFFEGMERLPESEVEALRLILEAEGLSAVREHRRSGACGR
jgi:pyruvate formate lyase activating enzyme